MTKRSPEEKVKKKAIIVQMTAFGNTVKECASVVGVTVRSINNWRKEDPEFRTKMDTARLAMQTTLKTSAFKLAKNGDKTMLIFLLKTLCGFRETAPVEDPNEKNKDELCDVDFIPAPKGKYDS